MLIAIVTHLYRHSIIENHTNVCHEFFKLANITRKVVQKCAFWIVVHRSSYNYGTQAILELADCLTVGGILKMWVKFNWWNACCIICSWTQSLRCVPAPNSETTHLYKWQVQTSVAVMMVCKQFALNQRSTWVCVYDELLSVYDEWLSVYDEWLSVYDA